MSKKRYSAEEIIQHLRTIELEQSKGSSLKRAVQKAGVSYQTIIRWRREYGGLKISQARRLKELEKENSRLKRLVADQALDIAILKDVSSGKF